MADKTQNVKTRLSFDGEAEYKAACKEINSTLKVLNSEMKLVTAEYKDKVNVGNEFKYDNDDKKPKPRGGGSAAGGVVVNQYIYANTTDYAKQQKEAARQFRMIARTV